MREESTAPARSSRRRMLVSCFGAAAVFCAIALAAFLNTPTQERAEATSKAELASIAPTLKSRLVRLRAWQRGNRRIGAEVARARGDLRYLAHQRKRASDRGHDQGYRPAFDRSYASAYREAFPIDISSGSSWYIVHVAPGGERSAWTATENQDYVIDGSGQITRYGLGAAPSPYSAPTPAPDYGGGGGSSGGDGYINSDGIWVPSPGADPTGATALCADGSYSYSMHASGTCSHHGGVSQWLP